MTLAMMLENGLTPLNVSISIAFGLLSLALLLAFGRLVWGPTLPDRVVALDLIAAQSVGIIALYTIATGHPALLRAAIVLALIIFLGTVAFAHYVERGSR